MTLRISNQSWVWFVLLATLILLANFSLYRVEFTQPITPMITIGSFLDFIVTIPILAYFLIIRRRLSIKYLFPFIGAGYVAAWLIIPATYFQTLSAAKYILFAVEGAFIIFELVLIAFLLKRLPLVIDTFKSEKERIPFFKDRLEYSFLTHFKPSKFLFILISEISVFYYSLFAWKKRPSHIHFKAFSYHKKTSTIALNIMIIHALIIESIGFHFLLHQWSPIIAIIALVINIYGLFMLLAEIQAVRLCPYLLSDQNLILQTGIMKKIDIPLKLILSVNEYTRSSPLSKQELASIFDAAPSDFIKEKPQIEIILKDQIQASYLYGMTKKVNTIHLRVDDPLLFLNTLKNKIES